MTDSSARHASGEDDDAPLLAFATILIRKSTLLAGLCILGMVAGVISGLATPRTYVATTTFMPQDAEAGGSTALSGLVMAASQVGLRVPSASGGKWNAAVYARLLRSRALLEGLARDTVVVEELGRRRIPVMDLLDVGEGAAVRRDQRAIGALQDAIVVRVLAEIGAVELRVSTRWPSVSLALADGLLSGVNQFTLQMRSSQAIAERRFAEARAFEAESSLRSAEDRLGEFLRRNRAIDESPELQFQRDRLDRAVTLRQQLFTTLSQSKEEARIREVRDTPVITLLERPQAPLQPEARGTLRRGVLGALFAVVCGVLAVVFSFAFRQALQGRSVAAMELAKAVLEFKTRLHPIFRG